MLINVVLAMAVYIGKACSQTLTILPECFSNGDTLTVNCATTDLTQTITFFLNGGNQGGCVPGIGCASGLTQSGSTTSMTISSFSDSTHNGSWTCTYGSSTSTAFIAVENPCEVSTEGTTKGTTTTPSTTTTTTTPSKPSTSPKKCLFFFEEESCALIHGILAAILVVIVLVALFAIGRFIIRKRNQRDLHQENTSDSRKENKGSNSEEHELHKQ